MSADVNCYDYYFPCRVTHIRLKKKEKKIDTSRMKCISITFKTHTGIYKSYVSLDTKFLLAINSLFRFKSRQCWVTSQT